MSVDDMSIRELKATIEAAGLSFAGCSEKSELRDRAREAQARMSAKPTTASSRSERARVSGWEVTFEYWNGGGEGDVDMAIILMHGIGASPDDLVPLGGAIASGLPGVKLLFAFPAAPGSSWWPLDPGQWMVTAMAGEASLARMIRTEFPGLADCRVKGRQLAEDVKRRAPKAKLVYGGFSQGAMTSTDIALNMDGVDGIVHISGAPIVVDKWAKALETRKPRVFISHGRSDFVLPFAVSGWSKSLFEQARVPLVYAPHDGGHAPGPMDPLFAFLKDTLHT